MTRINLDLGAGDLGRQRRELVDEFVAALAPTGRSGRRTMSEATARLLDAFDFDPERVALHYNAILDVAAEAYALEAEEMAARAANAAPPSAPMHGKYRTERAAKLAADITTEPFVVLFDDGSYDWFANGAAVEPATYQPVARRVTGRGWKATNR